MIDEPQRLLHAHYSGMFRPTVDREVELSAISGQLSARAIGGKRNPKGTRRLQVSGSRNQVIFLKPVTGGLMLLPPKVYAFRRLLVD
jgi:hypothetical protein